MDTETAILEIESEDDPKAYAEAIGYALDVLRNQRWIPVTEKLPDPWTWVLCWYEYFRYGDYNEMQEMYGVGFYGDGHWGGDVWGHKNKVLAWYPLPEPYRGENT